MKKKTNISDIYKKNDYRKMCPQFLLKFITFIKHNYFSSDTLREQFNIFYLNSKMHQIVLIDDINLTTIDP